LSLPDLARYSPADERAGQSAWISILDIELGSGLVKLLRRSVSGTVLTVAVYGLLMGLAQVQAGLILSIDSSAKQFWLTGSASGTTSSLGRVVWSLGNSTSAAISSPNTAAITTSPSLTVSQMRIGSIASSGATLGIWFNQINSASLITGVGSSQKVYYGGMDPTTMATFESGAGKTMSLSEGSGFGTLAVVPEPTASAMALAGLAGGLAMWRRKRA